MVASFGVHAACAGGEDGRVGFAGEAASVRPATIAAEFAVFYAAHVDALVAQLHAYTGQRAQAQDVVQEAFARALARWGRLCRDGDPLAWVRRVAFNLATSRWRQQRRWQAFARSQREQYVSGPGPERVVLVAALGQLPIQQRRAMVLFYLADLPIAEIARQDGVPEATVRSWLHRGRAALAAQLGQAGEEVP